MPQLETLSWGVLGQFQLFFSSISILQVEATYFSRNFAKNRHEKNKNKIMFPEYEQMGTLRKC